MHFQTQKKVVLDPTRGLYRWSRIFNSLQRRFFVEPVKLRREKQIEDFVRLNGHERVWFQTDTDVFDSIRDRAVQSPREADIAVITDQRFSRYPCPGIISAIKKIVEQCPRVYICLNRHYINLDDSWHDASLPDDFNQAITVWLKRELPYSVTDLSLDYRDYGHAFTWAIPDRHYLICR